jgi:lipopolysaccharide transport system permease protein
MNPTRFSPDAESPETRRHEPGPAHPQRDVLPVVVYTPESSLRHPGVLLAQMVRDLLASRELAWRLFVRDVQAMYRKSLLGYVWLLLTPVFMTAFFVFLNSRKILNVGETTLPYPAYVLTGMLLWDAFAGSLMAPLTRMRTATAMLTKLRFPHEALILTSVYEVVFNLCIKLLLLAVVFVWFQIPVTWTILLAPLAVMALIALGFTLGVLLVPIGQLYQDIGRSMEMVTRVWFFATPVIYAPPGGRLGRILTQVNPVSPALITAREWLTGEPLTQAPACLAVVVATAVVGLTAWILFRISMPHLIARMTA